MNGLRNVVREEELPGLGQCYIYDDGSHCPKQIDGEPVNPKWGLTKAGRPRKRAPPKPKAGPRNSRRSPDLDSGYGTSQMSQSSTSSSSFNSGRSRLWTPVTVARGATSSWNLFEDWPAAKTDTATSGPSGRPQNSTGVSTTLDSAVSPVTSSQTPTQTQQNGVRTAASRVLNEATAVLALLPMNGTFERKQINVPFFPDVLRIGRQTNAKTVPTPSNGFFYSKALSRRHAEVWAGRKGKIWIRDIKSSNGTFVNGHRLSPENRDSEPQELHQHDILELGTDIASEDQKAIVHHKVSAKVEYVSIPGSSNNVLMDDIPGISDECYESLKSLKPLGMIRADAGTVDGPNSLWSEPTKRTRFRLMDAKVLSESPYIAIKAIDSTQTITTRAKTSLGLPQVVEIGFEDETGMPISVTYDSLVDMGVIYVRKYSDIHPRVPQVQAYTVRPTSAHDADLLNFARQALAQRPLTPFLQNCGSSRPTKNLNVNQTLDSPTAVSAHHSSTIAEICNAPHGQLNIDSNLSTSVFDPYRSHRIEDQAKHHAASSLDKSPVVESCQAVEHGWDAWKVAPVSTSPIRTASSLGQISPGICPSTTPIKNPALGSLVKVYNSPDGIVSLSAHASVTSEGELSFVGSVDSDELAESWELGLDPAIRLIRAKLVDQLVSSYESGNAGHGQGSQHDGDDPSSNSQKSSDTNSSSGVGTKSSATSLGKHPRATDDGFNTSNEDNQRPLLKRKRKTAPAISLDGRLLACPYCKYDPVRYSERNQEEKDYRRCASSYLTTISRLKQHLYRVHKRPEHHCVSCFAVFVSKELLDSHTRQRPSCELRPPQFEEKMTFEQFTQIKRRAPAQDPSDTWFAIFRILFPGTALPHSPYVDSVSPEVIQDVLDYFYRQAQSRLSDLIRIELQGRMLMQGDQQRILDSALESAIAQLVSQRETSASFTGTQFSSQDVASSFPGPADIPSQTTGANAELHHQITAEAPLPIGAGHAGPPWTEVQFNYLGNGGEVENYLNAGYFEMPPELPPQDAFDGNMYTRWCQDG